MIPSSDKFYFGTVQDIEQSIASFDPRAYDKTRNYLDGQVTWLSPFLTHGITHTAELASHVLTRHRAKSCYRFLFELAWREYFHRTWQQTGDAIFSDLRHAQKAVVSNQLPAAMISGNCGINVLDEAVGRLKSSGLIHNHARMWLAAVACNLARTAWLEPARFLHYHLLDGDLASNTLSWQWVAGTFSHKRYLANQDNLNKFSRTSQKGTWLDVSYETLETMAVPDVLEVRQDPDLVQSIPGKPIEPLRGSVALRSVWQLNPRWCADIDQHIVFIDISIADRWPMSPLRWKFIDYWASQCRAEIVFGTIDELKLALKDATVVRQEYPACRDWPGTVLERDWLYGIPAKSFSSFSQFFKQVKSDAGL